MMNLLTGTIVVLIFSSSSIAAPYTSIPLWHAETRLGNGDPLLTVDSDDSYYEKKRQQQKQFEKQRQKKEDIRRRDKIDAMKKEQRLKRLKDKEKKKAGPR